MIVRETDHSFIMTTQHEHALFSSKVARNFTNRLFIDNNYFNDVLIAIQEHDRGWIRLDDTPIWNDRNLVPFSFMDYPLLPKLILYKLGLDEVEEMNDYAALLCSLHYSSFKHIQRLQEMDCNNFLNHELERQIRIKANLEHPNEIMILKHLKLLQLCDEISLYVCMNHPGVTKEFEHPWYREGFETIIEDQKINANWIDNNKIQIHPFIFKDAFSATIMTKQVSKVLIQRLGIDAAYKETDWSEQEVIIGSTQN